MQAQPTLTNLQLLSRTISCHHNRMRAFPLPLLPQRKSTVAPLAASPSDDEHYSVAHCVVHATDFDSHVNHDNDLASHVNNVNELDSHVDHVNELDSHVDHVNELDSRVNHVNELDSRVNHVNELDSRD